MIINRISKALINPTFLTNKSNHIGTSPQYSNDNYANILDAMNKMSSLNKAQISFGARNINDKDKDGYTVLMFAAEDGNPEAVQTLLNCDGIDVNAKDKDDYTALMYAAWNWNSNHPETYKALRNFIANKNA